MNRRTNSTARGGFTLVEMLVVLGILVVLVSLVAPRVLRSQKKADVNTAKTQIGLLSNKLEEYASDLKEFPTTEQGLSALVQQPADLDETANWQGPYLDSIPKDPWKNEYQYEFPPSRGSGETPDIWSMGPDKEDGTADDICSWETSEGSSGEGVASEGKGGDSTRGAGKASTRSFNTGKNTGPAKSGNSAKGSSGSNVTRSKSAPIRSSSRGESE